MTIYEKYIFWMACAIAVVVLVPILINVAAYIFERKTK